MEPDFTMVGHLPLPKRLLKLIETGRWPRTEEEELHQNLHSLVSKERIQSFALDQGRIYFAKPPFSTVASLIASGETFWSKFGALEQISPEMSISLVECLAATALILSMPSRTCCTCSAQVPDDERH